MGAWGAGAFEDDTALDWMDEAYSERGADAVRAALKAAAETPADQYLDYDTGAAARAAAEIVAIAHARAPGGLDDNDEAAAKEHAEAVRADRSLSSLALAAMERLLGKQSELCELWTEDPTNTEWLDAITDLRRRLKRGVE
ncbi:MAG: DUF4259 domain-containing protein [Silicimonas sp.]|jgi:hypothetical protein|nr:DUF4259 domain-containing protein [Silicimonas sp.]